ncbi:MAG: hypothetical protein DHS20C17_35910 [Cyclobacteriaceae bacterium]|nr:MAG: hypothetical protein DHS20C17_35910 [Cyclobacteriaceae bacterium]
MKSIWNLKVLGLLLGAVIFGVVVAQAQDEEPLTDEELTKYALVMDFADQEKERLKDDYNGMIQDEELMDGGRRFKELKDVADDSVKLAEIATPEELEVFTRIEQANEENIAAFKEAYTEKIKDKEQLGAGLYNRITKALRSDKELKTRYTAILETVKSERAAAEESADAAEASTDP